MTVYDTISRYSATTQGCPPWQSRLFDDFLSGLFSFLAVAGVLFVIGMRRQP